MYHSVKSLLSAKNVGSWKTLETIRFSLKWIRLLTILLAIRLSRHYSTKLERVNYESASTLGCYCYLQSFLTVLQHSWKPQDALGDLVNSICWWQKDILAFGLFLKEPASFLWIKEPIFCFNWILCKEMVSKKLNFLWWFLFTYPYPCSVSLLTSHWRITTYKRGCCLKEESFTHLHFKRYVVLLVMLFNDKTCN